MWRGTNAKREVRTSKKRTKMIIVLDTETTGLEPPLAEVIEIGAVSLNHGEPYRFASALIKPQGPIPPETSAIHHLTQRDFLKPSCASVDEAWIGIWDTLNGVKPLEAYVAHNAAFDKSFLPQFNDAPWLCTFRCSLHLLPDAPGHSNQILRYYLGLKPPLPGGLAPHRALYDCIVTMTILQEMLKIKTLEELLELQHRPVLLKTVKFGKWRGKLWSEIPREYLTWVSRQDFDADVLYTAEHWLKH
jgi:exodeoxyribonuclease X